MAHNNLFNKLSAFGFPLFETQESYDANQTLAEMVESNDMRLWEGFPVVLANSAEKGLFNFDAVQKYLKNTSDRNNFTSLVALSLALYKATHQKFVWADTLYQLLTQKSQEEYVRYLEKLNNDENIEVVEYQTSSTRLKSTFRNYTKQLFSGVSKLLSEKEEHSLEYALSQVFSPKQKELFLKKLRSEKLTKTEKEYFSRAVKKKVLALANVQLHRLAQKVLE